MSEDKRETNKSINFLDSEKRTLTSFDHNKVVTVLYKSFTITQTTYPNLKNPIRNTHAHLYKQTHNHQIML